MKEGEEILQYFADKSGFIQAEGRNLRKIKLQCREVRGNFDEALVTDSDLSESLFLQCTLMKADFSRADLNNAKFSGGDATRASFFGARGRNASFKNIKLREAIFSQSNLPDVTVRDCQCADAKFSLADMPRANCRSSDFTMADFREANLRGANFSGATLISANLSGANLDGAELSGLDLGSVDLRGASLVRANLSNSRLSNTLLSGADLSRANLRNAKLFDAILADPNGRGAKIGGADFRGATLRMVTPAKPRAMGASLLDLALCDGLEEAILDGPGILPEYLRTTLDYLQTGKLREAQRWPELVAEATKKLRSLRALYAPHEEPPSQLVDVVYDINQALFAYLKNRPEAIFEITPRQFEQLIAEILLGAGWEVDLTPSSKDGGYDILAIRKDVLGVQSAWVIECKRYAPTHKVGVEIVRGLFGIPIVREKHAIPLIATTSSFTKGAIDYKNSVLNLELKDYQGVLEWINQYRPSSNGGLFLHEHHLIVNNTAKLISRTNGGSSSKTFSNIRKGQR